MQRLEELFHEALSLEPGERADFVARVHASDPALGAEIESLLATQHSEASLIDSTAYEDAAEAIVDSETHLQVGRAVGRYRIIAQIGKGGMGEVYLAGDSSLGRDIALKLLPARFTHYKGRLRRFIQEAKAASALNHPNIITIHEIGEADGTYFIATEFIEGDTLRRHLAGGRLKLSEILGIAIQIANAIEAAHAAGIVHRDIKPENIMVRRDGYVKVLDFGLAKLTEKAAAKPEPPQADSLMATLARTGTEPGVVLGTVNYMSPEQARGLEVDPRSDIFSLGVVMYEMAAGRIAFTGETGMDVLVSILEKEPPLLSHYAPDAPAELQRIVTKALRKNREERYQTVRDLLLDLKSLNEELLFEEKLERSKPQAGDSQPRSIDSTQETLSYQTPPVGLQTQAEKIIKARSKRGLAIMIVAVAIAAAATTGTLMWLRTGSRPAAVAPAVAGPLRSVSYSIMVQKYRDGKPYEDQFRLRDDMNFEKDYGIRLNISSPEKGYLYLLNEGPVKTDGSPSFVVMFPSETANDGSAELEENQQIQIPRQSWFRFDEQKGAEKIWLVWAQRSVDELEAVKGFVNPKERGFVASPEMRSAVYEFLKSHSSSKPGVERDEVKKETIVRASGDMLVHVIKLEHH